METTFLAADGWAEKARALHDDGWLPRVLCGVDRIGLPHDEDARFEIVVDLIHPERKERMRLHVAATGDPGTGVRPPVSRLIANPETLPGLAGLVVASLAT